VKCGIRVSHNGEFEGCGLVGYHCVMWTLDANFLHSCWMLHVLLKHQTVVYDVPKGKNLVLVSTLASYFREPKVKT